MTFISLLIPFIDHTHYIELIKLLVKDAQDDLINGRLQGQPLVRDLLPSLLTLVATAKDNEVKCTTEDYIEVLIHLYSDSSHDEFVKEQLLHYLDSFNEGQLNTLTEISVRKSLSELKEEVRTYV